MKSILLSMRENLKLFDLDYDEAMGMFYFLRGGLNGFYYNLLSVVHDEEAIEDVLAEAITSYHDMGFVNEEINDFVLSQMRLDRILEAIVKYIKGVFQNTPIYAIIEEKRQNSDTVFVLEYV